MDDAIGDADHNVLVDTDIAVAGPGVHAGRGGYDGVAGHEHGHGGRAGYGGHAGQGPGGGIKIGPVGLVADRIGQRIAIRIGAAWREAIGAVFGHASVV